MKIQSNSGSSMPAISLESDDAALNPALLLFSQLIPLVDALQKMPETWQENVSSLPVSVVSEQTNLQPAQSELPSLFINGRIMEPEAYAPPISTVPNELSRPAFLPEYTVALAGDVSIPRPITVVNPPTTSDKTIPKIDTKYLSDQINSKNDISSVSREINPDKDALVDFTLPINEVPHSTLAQEIVAQSELTLKEKARIPELEIKSVLNQPEQVVEENDLLKSREILSLPVETKPVDTTELQSKEAITFSPLLKAADEAIASPAASTPQLVVNTMVDFINKKITSSPTEAVFSQGPKKIALTELQFNPQDLMSLKVDNYTAKLKVYPPDLGQVIAEIQIHNGQTELTIRTENPQVKHFIEQHLTHLRESFEQSNINLGQVNIQDNSSKDTSSRQQAFYSSSSEATREVDNTHKDPYLRDKKSSEQTIDTYA
jgi:flagellar hook-length control protein FliK